MRVLILPLAPAAAPSYSYAEKEGHPAQFDSTLSFGFVATAVLISMFLAMAIFEKFLRATEGRRRTAHDLESQAPSNSHQKLRHPSPKACRMKDAPEVSVVMPGNKVPTFLANPAPCRDG